MTDPDGFLADAVDLRGVSISKEGTQYVCTTTATNEHDNIDAESVFEAARSHDLHVDHVTANPDLAELYVYVDSNVAADGGDA